MTLCLLGGTQRGLIVGALLFQAASIFDGVDGEIARATFRTSARGAMLDSLVDAATNIACIGGVTFNLYLQGEFQAALAGATGLALFATGLAVIGRYGRSNQDGLTFNAVKDHFSARGSRLMTWLTWLTMRDFFALAGAVLIILGFAPHALFVFAVVAAGWLAVVLAVMVRQPA
jgi:CDP-L-myo-inositol myo-inositolphosphotransferase